MFEAAASSVNALTVADGPLDVTPFIIGAIVLLVLGAVALFFLLRRRGGGTGAADTAGSTEMGSAVSSATTAGAGAGAASTDGDAGLLDGDDDATGRTK